MRFRNLSLWLAVCDVIRGGGFTSEMSPGVNVGVLCDMCGHSLC